MYCEEIHELFKKQIATLQEPDDYRKKRQLLLKYIDIELYIKKLTLPIKIPRLRTEAQKKEDHMEKSLKALKSWIDLKFQVHWNSF